MDNRGFAPLNDASITLPPKKEGAIFVGGFKPVILIYNISKIVAKAMALHLAGPLLQRWTSIRVCFSRDDWYMAICY
jgi:hypothetical protein